MVIAICFSSPNRLCLILYSEHSEQALWYKEFLMTARAVESTIFYFENISAILCLGSLGFCVEKAVKDVR